MLSRPLRIVMAGCGVLLLASCADASTSATTDMSELPEKYYAGLALPAEEPEGLTAVRVEQLAHPERDGQRVMLMFGRDTVYVCSRPISGQVKGATKCPYPSKQSLLTADVGTLRIVMPSTAETRKSMARAVRSLVGTGFEPCWLRHGTRAES